MLIINLKAHEFTLGDFAIRLAETAKQISQKENIPILLAPQIIDLRNTSKIIPSFAQHIDEKETGSNTGYLTAEAVKNTGAIGTVLNHAEHKLSFEKLKETHKRAKIANLQTLVCAANLDEIKKIIPLSPDYIAYEPPELIGSTKETVSTSKPEIISKAVKILEKENIPLIIGAGIHSKEDIKTGVERGAKGAFVSTGVIKAQDKKKAISELIEGFKKA